MFGKPIYTLLSDKDYDWYTISRNPSMVPVLEQYPEYIDWNALSSNPNAIALLERNVDKIHWLMLSKNPKAIALLERNLDKIDYWSYLSANPNAIALLKTNVDKINWVMLARNPNAIALFETYPDKIEKYVYYLLANPNAIPILEELYKTGKYSLSWMAQNLSSNPNAVSILENVPDLINWVAFSRNESIDAIRMLRAHIHTMGTMGNMNMDNNVDWFNLSRNPSAVSLLEEHLDCVHWNMLSANPSAISLLQQYPERIRWRYLCENTNAIHILFPLDYTAMKQANQSFAQELTQVVFHPARLTTLTETYGISLEDYFDMI